MLNHNASKITNIGEIKNANIVRKSYFRKTIFFSVPLLFLLMWPSLLVFQVIPTYNSIKNEQAMKVIYDTQVLGYKRDIQNIQNNQIGDTAYVLNLLNRWVPTTSGTVSVVKEEFESLTSYYNLQLGDFRAGELITKASKDFLEDLQLESKNDFMRSIPIELKVEGEQESIFSFIDKVQHYTTFNMVKLLKLSKESDTWSANILILRVYFSENFELNKENFWGTTVDENVVKEIRNRAVIN